ncbi:ABC transporter ATP-binding protein [Planctomicrobium sp. SH661]|uniref:ABC transporter ATP-binding protein n=1 Tax=Planctomicrobium sp. SH661 TaxID=3448124 RepID=UPI003F5C9916
MTAIRTITHPGTVEPAAHSPDDYAVICRDVTKEYGKGDARVRALSGINLEINYGCMTLLVGPSGCGKTTLISIMAGLLDPTDGDVVLLGKHRRELKGRQLVKFRAQNIGFVFQQYNLLPSLTAAENVAVPLIIRGHRRKLAIAKGAEMLDAVGLGDKVGSYSAQLSGGQQQRVAIARALVNDPRLLVCDEPTAALDARSGRNVMELLKKTTVHPDRAVIVVTHDNRVFDFGDRIVAMSDGKIESIQGGG